MHADTSLTLKAKWIIIPFNSEGLRKRTGYKKVFVKLRPSFLQSQIKRV